MEIIEIGQEWKYFKYNGKTVVELGDNVVAYVEDGKAVGDTFYCPLHKRKAMPVPKVKLSPADRAVQLREDMSKTPLPISSRTLEHFFLREGAPNGVEVRLHSALFHDVIEDWAMRGQVILPSGHRAINHGARGGEPMWGIAATLDFSSAPLPEDIKAALDARGVNFNGDKINDLNFVRWLLLEGQPVGWKVTLIS